MTRITNTTKTRHKKILKLAKGMAGLRKHNFSVAKQAVQHKLDKQTIARKLLKRDMRRLWIMRINTFLRSHNTTYSRYMKNYPGISRKVLSTKIEFNPNSIIQSITDKMKKTN